MKTDRLLTTTLMCYCFQLVFFCCLNAYIVSESADKDETRKISIGFNVKAIASAEIKDVKAAVELMTPDVSEDVHLMPEVRLYETNADIIEDIINGKLDVGSATSLDYLQISKQAAVELAYCSLKGGKKTEKYLLLVHRDSDISSIRDLTDCRLAVKQDDQLGIYDLNTVLLRNGLREADKTCSSVIEHKTSSQVILSVFFKILMHAWPPSVFSEPWSN